MTRALTPHTTIAPGNVGESLFEDRKSQFFGFALHTSSVEELTEFRHGVMERIPAASHYVSACFLADGGEFFSDAKEPHGSAGMPVLNAIKGRDLRDVACVVARVFGGTLLGKGGLMRAYTKAASDALDAATFCRVEPCKLIVVTVPYRLYEPLSARLANWGAHVDDTTFADQVTLNVSAPSADVDELLGRIRDFSDARATCSVGGEEMRALPL